MRTSSLSSVQRNRRRRVRAAVAGTLVSSLVVAPVVAVANEGEEPLPPPSDREFSLGQSVQIRVNADAEPNSDLVDFRWSVNQLVVQAPEDGEVEVQVPERGAQLRSLISFDRPPQEGGEATLTADVEDGVGVARTVSLYPQDEEPPIELDANFTLDGEPITAADLVGKSGVVTAEYTLTNRSTEEKEVEVTNLAGDPVTRTVEADVPMVGLGTQLVPQDWGGLSVKGGAIGADGRGNTQIQYIALPFRPLSGDGTATFGWSARVKDAIVPSMLLQVAPIYIPRPDAKNKEKQDEGAGGLGIAGPNLSPAIQQISAGVTQLLQGVETLTSGGGGDPLTALEGNLNTFFANFGGNLTTVAELINPDNPDGATALVRELAGSLGEVIAAIDQIQSSNALEQLDQAASTLTPERAEQLAGLAPTLQQLVDNIGLISNAVTAICLPGPVRPPLPDPIGRPLTNEECDALKAAVAVLESSDAQNAIDLLNQVADQLVPVANTLQTLNTQLPGVLTTLGTLLPPLQGVLTSLDGALTGLSENVATIGSGLAEANIDLPTLDQVVSNVVSAVLSSPGGQDITGGLAQIGAGIGDAKSVLGDFIAEVVVAAQAAVEKGKNVAQNANNAVVGIKSSFAGLIEAAHTSPLPYGGDPADAPDGTVLAGAYEFRVDAADGNLPSTLPRILIGLLLLAGGAVLATVLGRRQAG